MISEKMKPYVKNNSAIRMMFEEGNRLRAKYGADKVFDFSLGNPSVPAPDSVRRRCKRPERNSEDDPEPGRRGDRFCTIFSGIRCICPQL